MSNKAKLNHTAVPKPIAIKVKTVRPPASKPILIKVKTKRRPHPDELVEYELETLERPHREPATFEVQMLDGDGNTVCPPQLSNL